MFDALKLDTSAINAQEEQIGQRVRELDDPLRKIFYDRLACEMKDPDTYAVLNFFFPTGLHHMYLGKYLRGTINLIILTIGIGCFLLGFPIAGTITVVFILCIELMALFRSQTIVTHHNNQLSEEILESIGT